MAESTAELVDLQAVSRGINEFSSSLYSGVGQDLSSNFVTSPLSLSVVLAMLKLGAGGLTAQELETVIKLPADNHVILSGFRTLSSKLTASRAVLMANRIFVHQQFKLKQDFQSAVEKTFDGQPQLLDFGDSSGSAEVINNWVAEKTQQKIRKLFKSDSFDSITRLVLVNALYFKGKWSLPFPTKETAKADFHLSSTETVSVDMMNQRGKRIHYASLECFDSQAILLPFEGDLLHMLLLLPKSAAGISTLEMQLQEISRNNSLFEALSQYLEYTKVDVSLPKFRIESTIDMKRVLQRMGLNSIFSDKSADLGGMLETETNLRVSEVIQKAVIDVNEEGVEGAAATGATVQKRSIEFPKEFIADRPFIFAIVHSDGKDVRGDNAILGPSASILFHGCVKNPVIRGGNEEPLEASRKDEL